MQFGTATSIARLAAIVAAVWVVAGCVAPQAASAADQEVWPGGAAALVAEVRRSFTIHGKPIPPQIFRDFGDGDMADSGSIWVTVDAAAAVGSNLYYDAIKKDGDYVTQTKIDQKGAVVETTAYTFWGATRNGLLVVIASYNGGGSGTFYTLHIVDVAAARGFDLEGKPYRRIDLSNVRSVILGDRWEGELKIANDTIKIITTRNGPADDSARAPMTITATRP